MPAGIASNGGNKRRNAADDNIMQFTKAQFEETVTNLISQATEPLKAEIAILKNEVQQLRESQNFTSNQNDDLVKDYRRVVQTSKKQKQDLIKLRKETEDLDKRRYEDETKIDELEQCDRRQNLELQGIPQFGKEDITQITLDLAKKINVDLEEEDISIVHRLPAKQRRSEDQSGSKTTKRHPTVIVRFVSRQKRNEMYENRFKAKEIEDFPVEGMKNLFVNENLTQRRKQLFWKTKQKAKELGFKYFWSNLYAGKRRC